LCGVRAEESSQGGNIGQVAGIEDLGELLGQFALAASIMGQRQQINHDLARLPVRQPLNELVEGPAVFLPREELVAIDEIKKRHRLFAQGMDDVPIIDDLIVSPVGMASAPGQRHQLCSSDKNLEA